MLEKKTLDSFEKNLFSWWQNRFLYVRLDNSRKKPCVEAIDWFGSYRLVWYLSSHDKRLVGSSEINIETWWMLLNTGLRLLQRKGNCARERSSRLSLWQVRCAHAQDTRNFSWLRVMNLISRLMTVYKKWWIDLLFIWVHEKTDFSTSLRWFET